MTQSTKTTKTSKAKAAEAQKAQDAAPAAAKAAKVESQHQFDNADDLAHFIHHNPQFGTLPLDEQDALRAELIELKREKPSALVLTEGDALADLNGTRRPDNHVG